MVRPGRLKNPTIAPRIDAWEDESAYTTAVMEWQMSLNDSDVRALAHEFRVMGNQDPACRDAQIELDRRMAIARSRKMLAEGAGVIRCEAHQYRRGRAPSNCEACLEARGETPRVNLPEPSIVPEMAINAVAL